MPCYSLDLQCPQCFCVDGLVSIWRHCSGRWWDLGSLAGGWRLLGLVFDLYIGALAPPSLILVSAYHEGCNLVLHVCARVCVFLCVRVLGAALPQAHNMGWSTPRTSETMSQSKSFPLWWFGWECHTHLQASGFDQGSCLGGSGSAVLLVKCAPGSQRGTLWDHIASPYFQCPVSLLRACVWTGELAAFCSRGHACHLPPCLPAGMMASYPPGPYKPK